MITRYQHKSLTWIDVVAPTSEAIHELLKECDIPPSMATDLTSMTPLTEIQTTKQALKLTFDYPIVKRSDINHPHEIKFIATKHHLITIRFEDIEALDRFAREFEVVTILGNSKARPTGGHLLLILLRHLYVGLGTKLDYLEARLIDIQDAIFSGQEKEMVTEISEVNRRLITFRQVMAAHEPVVQELDEDSVRVFSKSVADLVPAIEREFRLVNHKLESLARTIDELRETNNSLLTTKQNEIMKILTIMAFITFPLTLFTSMFGMNTLSTPIIGRAGDFWIIVSIMVMVSICFFAFFRYKKWM